MRRCAAPPLEEFASSVFRALGADAEIAAEAGRHLVRANLSGHDSHGIIRLAQYVAQTGAGDLKPAERPVVVKQSAVTALIDGCRSVGLYSTKFAIDWAIERARTHGTASAAVRHSSHIGRLGEYTEHAADQGFASIVTVGAAGPGVGGMALFGGTQRFLGANPWSIGIPGSPGEPVVFDGSTSAVAEGKVRVARAKGTRLPAGCIIDSEGRPTDNPNDFYAGGALLPLGGTTAGHKGYCLALTSALLGGISMIGDSDPSFIGAQVRQEVPDARGRIAGVFVTVFDPDFFGGAGAYRAMVIETVEAARRVSAGDGTPVLMPGEIERRSRIRRAAEGIAIPDATWKDLEDITRRFGLRLPEVMPS
jgi:uncharacterized oxidoreductase